MYSKELAFETARPFRTICSFESAHRDLCNFARRSPWWQEFADQNGARVANGHWTPENLAIEAQKYPTRNAFAQGSPGAYKTALRLEILGEICQHMERQGNLNWRQVYVFEFADGHCYVGLSMSILRRKAAHLAKGPVHNHLKNCPGFVFKPLTELVPHDEAAQRERFYISDYRARGWSLLNRRNGGALGGLPIVLTYEYCAELAAQHRTRKALHEAHPGVIEAITRNGWGKLLQNYDRLTRPAGYWTPERCVERADQYTRRSDFHRHDGSAYAAASNLGILDQICAHMGPPAWTKQACQAEAQKCKSRTEFRRRFRSAHAAAKSEGWLDDFFPLPTRKWSLEACRAEAAKWPNRSMFQSEAPYAYRAAYNSGWLDEIAPHMPRPRSAYTYADCAAEAKKYLNRTAFHKGSGGAYRRALREGWLDEICEGMEITKRPHGTLTKKYCHEVALNYATQKALREAHPTIITQASRMGWGDEIFKHMQPLRRPGGCWTEDAIVAAMAQCETKTDFRKKFGGAASAADRMDKLKALWNRSRNRGA